MSNSLFFYDLETTGINPREARVMQFAGQRTSLDLKPIGEPINELIRLSPDVIPEPDAILITGITPQKANADGISEASFLRLFHEKVAIPGTTFVGFNSIRFDDEFMRFMQYRNYFDPYEWQWSDGRAKWDLLDVIRMTRALRPEGIAWPFASDGKPSNRLELLTAVNKLDHTNAHDALSDVRATIAVAQLIRDKQPKLFDFLYSHKDKKAVSELVLGGKPFIYTSGKYDSEFEKTTIVDVVTKHPDGQAAYVFDLRFDPSEYKDMTTKDIVTSWKLRYGEEGVRLPVKTMKFNRCPAVAPMSVLDAASQKRLKLDPKVIQKHAVSLASIQEDLGQKLLQARELMEKQRQEQMFSNIADVDAQLYEGFVDSPKDKTGMRVVRSAAADELKDFDPKFSDKRLQALFPLYKARNFPEILSDEERTTWEAFLQAKLMGGDEKSRLAKFFDRLGEIAAEPNLSSEKQYLLEELQLYGQSLLP